MRRELVHEGGGGGGGRCEREKEKDQNLRGGVGGCRGGSSHRALFIILIKSLV